jgi:hypothetical protein
MIIDIHRHALSATWQSENYWDSFVRMALPILRRMGIDADAEMVKKNIIPIYFDTDGERHVAAMQEAGIAKSVMFTFDIGLIAGEPPVPIREQNEAIIAMSRKYPDTIIPFVSIDPRRPGAGAFVKEAVEEWGAKGLKIHPGAGFNPEEKETLDLVESIAGYGIPVITHTGAAVAPTSSRYLDPVYLDAMLLRFPEVIVIASHMGYGHRHQLFSLGMNRPNLYTDISAWQTTARDRYDDFAEAVKGAVAHFGPERVLFGTDNPFLWPVLPEPAYVQLVRDLSTRPQERHRLTKEEVDMILGKNAARLLGL